MPQDRSFIALETVAVLAFALLADGCGRFGQVNQGRVIQYDREQGLVTFIQDANYREPDRPRFDILPPVTVRVPADPGEMGPAPEAGKLLALDSERRRLSVYDSAARRIRTIPYTPVDERRGLYGGDARLRTGVPRIDRQNRTITVYDSRRRLLVTFSVSDEDFNLPADTWKTGDDIRYYSKEPGQALRMMNVTRAEASEDRR